MKTSTKKSKSKPKSKPVSDPVLVTPDPTALSMDRDKLISDNSELKVTDGASYNYAMELVASCKAKVKQFEDHFAGSKKMLNDYKRKIDADLRALIEPVKQLSSRAWGAAMEWKKIQEEEAERKRREEQRLAQEREKQRLEAEAKEIEKEDPALAEEVRSTPVEIPLAPAAPAGQQSTAVSIRHVWSAEVVDIQALLNYVAANPQFLNLILPNQVALNEMARAQKKGLAIPGVRVKATPIPASR